MASQKQRARSGSARSGAARTATTSGGTAARGQQRTQGSARRTGTGASAGASATATRKTAANGTAAKASGTSSKPKSGQASGAAAVAAPAGRGPLGVFRTMGWMQLATFVLSLFGLGVSIYLTIAHFDTHVTLACSDKGLVNCEEVTTSPTSMVFGVFPVAVLGLAFYVFMTAINSPWAWRWQLPAVRWLRLGSLIAGMCFVLYLIYAELIDIGAICLWCTSVHVVTFLLFAIIVFNASFSWGTAGSGRKV
jgi:uncharacterized membrane protein